MATAAQHHPATTSTARSSPVHVPERTHSSNSDPQMATAQEPIPPAPAASKKTKGKKSPDPNDASKAIRAKIAQLEQNRTEEKDQEAEIERDVKKANRDLSHVLSSIDDPLKRIDIVQRKYSELYAEMKRTEREHIKAKKRGDQLQKEKDAGRSELTKMTTMKDNLEKLSRNLTKENKKLKEDKLRLETNDSRNRRELHQRLENMCLDVEEVIRLRENPQETQVEMKTDELFREKFKSFVDQYEKRELYFQSLLQTKEWENQYHLARLDKQRREQEVESTKSHQLTKQVSTFSQTETELRQQLNIYVEKFKQVEDTLNNSNDLFLTFRREMEDMSKKTKRLEKENLNLTRKQEATNRNILEMAEERTTMQKELELLRKKNANLEKLCRGMQAQGRGQVIEADEEGTESDYDEYEEEDDEDAEYDDDTEEEAIEVRPRPFGSVPPPPPPPQSLPNGKANGAAVGRQLNAKWHQTLS